MDAVKFEVPPELFVATESSSFAGQLNVGTLEAGPDTYRFKKPVEWNVTVTNTGDALLVMGAANGTASVPCARCLDDFDVELAGEVEGYFLLADGPAPEGMDDDEFDVLGADRVLDLEPLIIAALLVEMPLVPLCREDCAGLCAQCGANLNEGPCECSKHVEEDDVPRMSDGRVSPFAALKDLDLGQ